MLRDVGHKYYMCTSDSSYTWLPSQAHFNLLIQSKNHIGTYIAIGVVLLRMD